MLAPVRVSDRDVSRAGIACVVVVLELMVVVTGTGAPGIAALVTKAGTVMGIRIVVGTIGAAVVVVGGATVVVVGAGVVVVVTGTTSWWSVRRGSS